MRKIDAACDKILNETVFFDKESTMFYSGYYWGVLMCMINDDYADIVKCDSTIPAEFKADPV